MQNAFSLMHNQKCTIHNFDCKDNTLYRKFDTEFQILNWELNVLIIEIRNYGLTSQEKIRPYIKLIRHFIG